MKDALNISQTAKLLRVCRPVVYRLISEGRLTAHRNTIYKAPGGPVLIPRSQVEAIAREHGIPLEE